MTRRDGNLPGRQSSAVLIFAAGGVLWKPERPDPVLAVVHRPHHGDWVLPKGKLDPGERFPDAALREVREETHCDAELAEFAGVDAYPLKKSFKIVLYWHMGFVRDLGFAPGPEIDAILWLSREDAIRRLDHPGEREILARDR